MRWIVLILSVFLLASCSNVTNESIVVGSQHNFTDEIKNLVGTPGVSKGQKEKTSIPPTPTTDFYPEFPQYTFERVKVKKVINGELVVTQDGNWYKLLGVDTSGNKQAEKRMYLHMKEDAAKQFISKELLNQTVYIEISHPEQQHKNQEFVLSDRGRRQPITLAYLWKGNQEKMVNMNALLIEKGLALALRQPPLTLYDSSFKELENLAHKQKIGIWEKGNSK